MKLGVYPLIRFAPERHGTGPWSDHITSTTYDRNRGVITADINDGVTRVVITGIYSSATNTLVEVDVKGVVGASPLIIARVNRLLDGLDAPRLEKYHRTGTLVWRFTGQPLPVGDIEGRNSGTGWSWYSLATPTVVTRTTAQGTTQTVIPAPVAPSAPSVTPTPPPVSPIVAPEPAPAPEPEPVAAAPEPVVAPLKVTVSKADSDTLGLFVYPQRSTTNRIKTSPENLETLRAAWAQHEAGFPSTVALVGPAGTGKTSILDDLAAEKSVGIFTFDAAGAASFSDWVGTTALAPNADGKVVTRFVYSAFIEAIRSDGAYGDTPRIVRIDEVNRAESSGATNALMSILAQGSIYIPETGHTIPVSRAVFWAFTLNRGSAYAGTTTLDAALTDRMESWVRLDYLPEDDEVALVIERVGISEEDARPLVRAARQVREVAARGEITTGISTRRVLAAAMKVRFGLTPSKAAEACWTNSYADEGGAEGERGIVLMAVKSVLG